MKRISDTVKTERLFLNYYYWLYVNRPLDVDEDLLSIADSVGVSLADPDTTVHGEVAQGEVQQEAQLLSMPDLLVGPSSVSHMQPSTKKR